MTRKAAAKKLDALDVQLRSALEARRTLETEAFGAELDAAARRERYLAVGDDDLRRRLIDQERELHELRLRQREAAVRYWQVVVDETRAKLDDLKSDSPTSDWRRGIWWDVLTVFWILVGAGWLAYSLVGAGVGAVISAACAWYIARSRKRRRPADIQEGEEVLRSGNNELQRAQRPVEPALFAAADEAAAVTDGQ